MIFPHLWLAVVLVSPEALRVILGLAVHAFRGKRPFVWSSQCERVLG